MHTYNLPLQLIYSFRKASLAEEELVYTTSMAASLEDERLHPSSGQSQTSAPFDRPKRLERRWIV